MTISEEPLRRELSAIAADNLLRLLGARRRNGRDSLQKVVCRHSRRACSIHSAAPCEYCQRVGRDLQ